jgi:cobalt-zinc-cadmium efflux system membrane fusion protein
MVEPLMLVLRLVAVSAAGVKAQERIARLSLENASLYQLELATTVILIGAVSLLGGCGRSETPAPSAASQPQQVTKNTDLVTIPPDSPQAKQMRVEPVRTADVPTDEVVAPGKIMINPNRTSKLLLPIAGRIVSVMAQLGDSVVQGQPLVAIESPDADAAVAAYHQGQATERQAQAALTKAQTEFDRAGKLYEAETLAQKDLVAAENDLAQAKAALETARAGVEQARRKLEVLGLNPTDFHQRTFARAPISGKVLEINVAPGEYRNDTSAPLMTIADLSTVWVSSDVPESGIRLIHIGDRMTTTCLAYPGETFSGRVARIADVVDPQSRTLKVYLDLANPQGRFRAEMFCTISHARDVRSVPVLPVSAVIQEYGKSFVFVERGPGQYERREVTIGARSGDLVPVLSGVQVGDRVIVDGAVLLRGQ